MNAETPDQTLCAFIDGELDLEEEAELIARMREDAGLRERVCALRASRDMVRLAYAKVPARPTRARLRGRGWRLVGQAAAAALVLAVGLAGGWLLQGHGQGRTPADALVTLLPEGLQPVRLVAEAATPRVLLHVDSADPAKVRELGDYVQAILEGAERRGVAIEIEILANYDGLSLLRADLGSHQGPIAELAAHSPQVSLVACGRTVERLRREGESVVLLPAVREAPSAIGEIVDRLQAGWAYIKV